MWSLGDDRLTDILMEPKRILSAKHDGATDDDDNDDDVDEDLAGPLLQCRRATRSRLNSACEVVARLVADAV
eukprot:SAG22_NODE_9976_length_560_cov_1.106291_1_plen_71_part_10